MTLGSRIPVPACFADPMSLASPVRTCLAGRWEQNALLGMQGLTWRPRTGYGSLCDFGFELGVSHLSEEVFGCSSYGKGAGKTRRKEKEVGVFLCGYEIRSGQRVNTYNFVRNNMWALGTTSIVLRVISCLSQDGPLGIDPDFGCCQTQTSGCVC